MAEPMKTGAGTDWRGSGSSTGEAATIVSETANKLGEAARQAKDEAASAIDDASASLGGEKSVVGTLKTQAAQAASEAKSAVSAMADEARHRIAEIVDQQKNAGADQVAGVAKAAQSAAGDLQNTNPALARLVRTAAESVDHVAEDIRGSNLGDILGSLSDFGRRQPVAFFGGAVLAGFLLARFLKSDAPAAATSETGTRPYRA